MRRTDYIPYMMGERIPYLDAGPKAVYFGLSVKNDKKDMLRTVMEGVTYSLKDCLERIKELGVEAVEVRASGGGGRSRLWNRCRRMRLEQT